MPIRRGVNRAGLAPNILCAPEVEKETRQRTYVRLKSYVEVSEAVVILSLCHYIAIH